MAPPQAVPLTGQVSGDKVYRMSVSVSVLLHHYLRGRPYGIEYYDERIELGLFTRDEMTWAHEFAGMETQYDSEGLMGRGLYIGKHAAEVRPELSGIKMMQSGR